MPTPLVLTGGPAVGKSTTGRLLARRFTRAAFIDVDDIRQLVIAGSAAPWEGAEGLAQQELGVLNTCGLAERFRRYGFQVVIADVLTPHTEHLDIASQVEAVQRLWTQTRVNDPFDTVA